MKTVLAATLVLFTISTSSFAFDMPNIDGIQQMIQSKGGKRSQRAQQGGEGQGQQQSGQGGTQGSLKSLMNGDTSGLQGMMNSFGR